MSELPSAGETPAPHPGPATPVSPPEAETNQERGRISTKAFCAALLSGSQITFPGESQATLKMASLGDEFEGKAGTTTSKFSLALNRNPGYHIIPYRGGFYYSKIGSLTKFSDALGGMYSSAQGFTVLREGFVVIPGDEKKIVYVTIDDIRRNRVRGDRAITVKRGKVTYADFVNGTFGGKSNVRRPAAERTESADSGSAPVVLDQLEGAFDGLTDEELALALQPPPQEE